MKIQYISDIHMEFFTPKIYSWFLSKLKPQSDILILAGDICFPNETYKDFVQHCSKHWKKTYFVSGNHEYYHNGSLEKTNQLLHSFQTQNVKFLNNDVDYYEDLKFVGSTFWSKIPDDKKTLAKNYLNDFVHIDWNVEKYNEEHKKCVEFLNKELQGEFPTIVITHHLPSFKLIHPFYQQSIMNICFASDNDFLFKPNIKAWFFGHSHKPVEAKVEEVQFFSNPIGYIGENKNFTINKVVKL